MGIQTAGEQKYYDFIEAQVKRIRTGMIVWGSLLAVALIGMFSDVLLGSLLAVAGAALAVLNLKSWRDLKEKLDVAEDKEEFFRQLVDPESFELKEEHIIITKDYVLLGHNIIFDFGFLKQAARNRDLVFERCGMDTLKIARKLLPPEVKKTLQRLCDRFGILREHSHRALDDAKAAQELYEILESKYESQCPEIFVPVPLIYKVKKQSPATNRQKNHLQELADYHNITLNLSWDTLTKNEASRQIDKIIVQYGRIPK